MDFVGDFSSCGLIRMGFCQESPAIEVQKNDRETLIQALREGGGKTPCKAGKTAMHYAADGGKCHGWIVMDCSHGKSTILMVFTRKDGDFHGLC